MAERTLYFYDFVDLSFDDVAEVLANNRAVLLQPATEEAVKQARAVQRDLIVELGGFEVGREVTIDVGEVRAEEDKRLTVELRWHATTAAALFPSMHATLEVAALSIRPPRTQLSLLAHYRPPLSVLGAAGDAVWGHRIAESAVHRFLSDLVSRVEPLVAAQSRPAGGTD